MTCFLYIALCKDGSFYTGITSDPKKREFQHNNRIKSSRQLSKLPLKIIYIEIFKSRKEAAKREKEIKGWKREKKIRLIRSRRISV